MVFRSSDCKAWMQRGWKWLGYLRCPVVVYPGQGGRCDRGGGGSAVGQQLQGWPDLGQGWIEGCRRTAGRQMRTTGRRMRTTGRHKRTTGRHRRTGGRHRMTT